MNKRDNLAEILDSSVTNLLQLKTATLFGSLVHQAIIPHEYILLTIKTFSGQHFLK